MTNFDHLKGLQLEFPKSGHTFELRYWPKESPTKEKFQKFDEAVLQAQDEILPRKGMFHQRPLYPYGDRINADTNTAWEYLGIGRDEEQALILDHALRVAELMGIELEFDGEGETNG